MATILGHPNWQDPERRQSINAAAHVRMTRGFLGYRNRSAWAANPPARAPLIEAMDRVADLIERRRDDFWNGESTQPGWALEFTMHGRTLTDAQPTIICSSTSGRCRRNAKKIILREEIVVDDRGIGLEFYSDPVILYGGPSSNSVEGFQKHSIERPSPDTCSFPNAVIIESGSERCTGGGVILIDGEPFLLTVAHTFEGQNIKESPSLFDVVMGDPVRKVNDAGSLWTKRLLDQDEVTQNFDWALCSLDTERVAIMNGFITPAGKKVCPTKIATERDPGTSIYVITATKGTIGGKILSDHSLFMSPGGKKFQHVCSIVLDRSLAPGDCGSWVLNADNGDFYGHIIAGKASSTQAYFITAEDIFADISESLKKTVTLPPPCGSDAPSLLPLVQCHDGRHPSYWWPQLRNSFASFPKLFEIISLGASGGSLVLLSAGSFLLKDIPVKNDLVIRGTEALIECGTATFNCTEPTPRCSNAATFDFKNLWNITARYLQECPDGPWLFRAPQSLALTSNQKEWLSNDACEAISGMSWTIYPKVDIWSRLTSWKFPLLQLIALFPRPPLGFYYEAFVIIHMLGDPIGTLASLLYKLDCCQLRAVYWQRKLNADLLGRLGGQYRQDNDVLWKACAMIVDSYDEWGTQAGDQVNDWLEQELSIITRSDSFPQRRQRFRRNILRAADALAADRSTKILPVMVGIALFIATSAVAMIRTSATNFPQAISDSDVYSVAFASLYFWLVPTVILASLIGTSQTRLATPRILQRFERDCNAPLSGRERELALMAVLASRDDLRIWNGGIYSWQPGRAHYTTFQTADVEHRFYTSDQKNRRSPFKQLLLSLLHIWPLIYYVIPVFIVLGSIMTGLAITISVPPLGWSCQTRGVLQIFLVWFGSYLLSFITFGHHYKAQFWSTFIKDIICFCSTMGIIIATQIGVYNRCSCYTKGGLTGLQLPQMPMVTTILENGLQRRYPVIITVGILFQLIFIPGLIMLRYNSATRVYMQRDDGESIFGRWCSLRWWPFAERAHDRHIPRYGNEVSIEEASGGPSGLKEEKQVHNDTSHRDEKRDVEQC